MGMVKYKDNKYLMTVRDYDTEGREIISAIAATSITSGWLCDFYPSDSGYVATPITSGSLKKCYAKETLSSGDVGEFVTKGFCDDASATGGTSTSFSGNEGNAITMDSGITAGSALSSDPEFSFGVLIATGTATSTNPYTNDIFLDNDLHIST